MRELLGLKVDTAGKVPNQTPLQKQPHKDVGA